jgi:Protein of unknown function (DUF992)
MMKSRTQNKEVAMFAKKIAVLLGKVLALSLVLSSFAQRVNAADTKVSSLLFTCNISFTAHGESVYIGLGYTHLAGKGVLSCYDLLTGASQHINLKVNAMGPGLGLGVTGFDISGAATGLKIAKDPESLLGRYVSIRANAAVGVGVAASVPIRVSKDDVSINVSVEGLAGLGAGLDFLSVDLEADGKKVIDPAPAPALASAPPVVAAPAPAAAAPTTAQVVFTQNNQPVQIVDTNGHVLETLYIKSKTN